IYRFPKNENLRKQWLHACRLSIKDDVRNVYICSDHFRNDDYRDNRGLLRTMSLLKQGLVPSINIPNPSVNIDANQVELQSTENVNICLNESSMNVNADVGIMETQIEENTNPIVKEFESTAQNVTVNDSSKTEINLKNVQLLLKLFKWKVVVLFIRLFLILLNIFITN
ncbi:hypothetical protein ALC62_02847, partial [Cyphomyrmex costatus]